MAVKRAAKTPTEPDVCRHCGKPIKPHPDEPTWHVHVKSGDTRCDTSGLYDAMPADNDEPCDCWPCTNIGLREPAKLATARKARLKAKEA